MFYIEFKPRQQADYTNKEPKRRTVKVSIAVEKSPIIKNYLYIQIILQSLGDEYMQSEIFQINETKPERAKQFLAINKNVQALHFLHMELSTVRRKRRTELCVTIQNPYLVDLLSEEKKGVMKLYTFNKQDVIINLRIQVIGNRQRD
ncbi:hypothetical protein ABEB36_008795 [Hypothenemus hampei]|uniref:Uncharacterized protein n=1 Tax=Hypothenemus hampei TaxID=57062 RepID=A0ABD1EN30_HYPHA